MQRARYKLTIDWLTFVLIFVVVLILSIIPYVRYIPVVAAIAAILYMFVKKQY